MTCQSTDLELLSRFQVELHGKVSPKVANGVHHQMPFDCLVLPNRDLIFIVLPVELLLKLLRLP
jgi:hypothetical protein